MSHGSSDLDGRILENQLRFPGRSRVYQYMAERPLSIVRSKARHVNELSCGFSGNRARQDLVKPSIRGSTMTILDRFVRGRSVTARLIYVAALCSMLLACGGGGSGGSSSDPPPPPPPSGSTPPTSL